MLFMICVLCVLIRSVIGMIHSILLLTPGIASSVREPKRWVVSSLGVGSGDPRDDAGTPGTTLGRWDGHQRRGNRMFLGGRWGLGNWCYKMVRIHLNTQLCHWKLICTCYKHWDFHGFSIGMLVYQRVRKLCNQLLGHFGFGIHANLGRDVQ